LLSGGLLRGPEVDRENLGGAMKLEILQVPDCPNAAVLAARLAELADVWPDLTVTREIVTIAHDARRLGMTGSPTLLADGTRPVRPSWAEPLDLLPPIPRRARPRRTGAIARTTPRGAAPLRRDDRP
jgi:hypothetical protein